MANRKKEIYKPKPMTEGKRNIIQGLFRRGPTLKLLMIFRMHLKTCFQAQSRKCWKQRWMIILDMTNTDAPVSLITAMVQNQKVFVVNTGSLPLMYLKIGRVPLNHRLYLKEKRTFQRLMTKLSPCTQKE